MLSLGEPCAKKSKIEKQRLYNEKRKEKPRKPQFSLNFQFEFGEEEEMKENPREIRYSKRNGNKTLIEPCQCGFPQGSP